MRSAIRLGVLLLFLSSPAVSALLPPREVENLTGPTVEVHDADVWYLAARPTGVVAEATACDPDGIRGAFLHARKLGSAMVEPEAPFPTCVTLSRASGPNPEVVYPSHLVVRAEAHDAGWARGADAGRVRIRILPHDPATVEGFPDPRGWLVLPGSFVVWEFGLDADGALLGARVTVDGEVAHDSLSALPAAATFAVLEQNLLASFVAFTIDDRRAWSGGVRHESADWWDVVPIEDFDKVAPVLTAY